MVVVVVGPSRGRPFQRVSPDSGPLLQVVKPQRQSRAVFQGGGGVDQGVGQELARLFQVAAVLNSVSQNARQQTHVFSFGFYVARFEKWEMGEDKRDDLLLRLTLPLADYSCRRGRTRNQLKIHQFTNSLCSKYIMYVRV